MGRPTIGSVVEGIITLILKKKVSYRNINDGKKAMDIKFLLSTMHLVKHSIGTIRDDDSKTPKKASKSQHLESFEKSL